MTARPDVAKSRVIIIGAGFGGLAVARGLEGADVDVLVIDVNNFHTFQPLLYQVATAGLDGENISYAVRGILRPRRRWARSASPTRARFRMARVVGVDLAGRSVELDTGESVGYDVLVIGTGAVAHDYGTPGVHEHAFALKHVDDALRLRAHVLDTFERAAEDPAALGAGVIDVVVCGGGATGVEMAGGLHELYHKVLAKDFPDLPVDRARIVVVEMADRLLTPFTPASSARAKRTLERRGVEVRLGVGVAAVEPDRVVLSDGSSIAAGTVVWATGVTAEPLAGAIGTPTGRGGRLAVEPDMTLPGHPEVFAVGDVAAASGTGDVPLPQVAQPAIQGGRHVADQIRRRLAGLPSEPFRYHDKGQMATIGRRDAVTELANGWRFGGTIGWLSWLGLHLVYLMGFRNRIVVLVNWTWSYLTYDRASRVLREGERRRAEAAANRGAIGDADGQTGEMAGTR
ncbi:MAG: NAD(P)/FAD-dependent oxidoreductase [Ilumatobacteraceae bacterium]